jgi:hypothetical protein
MTSLTHDYLNLFDVFGLKATCTSNRSIILNFNLLNRQQIILSLMTKTNEGFKIVIPPFITKNNDYFRSRKSYIKVLLNI